MWNVSLRGAVLVREGRERTHADQLVVDKSVDATICEQTPCILGRLNIGLAVQRCIYVSNDGPFDRSSDTHRFRCTRIYRLM